MKDFKKLSRNEMKNVTGGHTVPPQCHPGDLCHGAANIDGSYIITTGTCDGACSCTAIGSGSCNNN